MSTAIATIDPEHDLEPVRFGKFTFATTGLLVDDGVAEPTFEEWAEAGHVLKVMARGIQFAVGDWLNYGEARFGELAAQVIDARDWQEETVRVYRWVSARVPPPNRVVTNEVTFTHHLAVASLPEQKQREWLSKAAAAPDSKDPAWSVARLKSEIKHAANTEAATESGRVETDGGFWVLVSARDPHDQEMLKKEMEQAGRNCKIITKGVGEEKCPQPTRRRRA